MWRTFLRNYKYFSCQWNCLLLLLEGCKNHYRKENNSVGTSLISEFYKPCYPVGMHLLLARMLESLAGCLTELCASDFYWIFFSFRVSLMFQLRYQFPGFFQAVFQANENPPAQIFPEQLLNLIIWVKFNVWGTFLWNYKYFSCQWSCLLLLLEGCKNHYRKENNSVGTSLISEFYKPCYPVRVHLLFARMLESLAGCLTELCASNFYWIFFSFRVSLMF